MTGVQAVAESVLIVDSGMRSVGGHNFSYTSAVKRALERQGRTVAVLANRGLPSELAQREGFRPMFSCGAYDHPLGHGFFRDMSYLRAQSRVFAEEAEHGLRCILKKAYDLVLSHTIADFELLGWLRVLSRGVPVPRLAVVLRQTPGYSRAGRLRLSLHPYWRLRRGALARLRARMGSGFLLCTDSELLSEDYANVYSAPILTLPIPLDPALWEEKAEAGSRFRNRPGGPRESLRVGYLGDARESKGFGLLPELIGQTQQRLEGDVHFVVQCPPPASDQDGTLPPAFAELRGLAARDGRAVTLIDERLSLADYAGLLRSLDVVLVPYQAEGYREPTSGIFAEAVALAKIVIVPRDTWMARQLDRGSGLSFGPHRADAIADAIVQVRDGYDQLRARAEELAPAWRRHHNADTLASALLGATGTSPSV